MIQYPVPPSQWRCLPANQLDTVIGLIETARDVLDRIEQPWEKAPDVRQVLLTLAGVAENYTPRPGANYLAAATAAQKPNTVIERRFYTAS